MTKNVLITGSTSGIGKAFADRFAVEGYNLVLVSRDSVKLAIQADSLMSRFGIKVNYIVSELSRDGSAKQVADTVKALGITVHILINNAGFNEVGSFLDTNIDKELGMIRLHVISTTELTKLLLPDMVSQGYGRILNVGSTGSYISCPNDSVYAATKAYLLHLSNALYHELKGTGVTVTTLCPGSTKTEFAKKAGMEDTLLFKLFVMDADRVCEIGYRGLMKSRRVVIPGLYNKLLVASSKVLPMWIVSYITKIMISRQG